MDNLVRNSEDIMEKTITECVKLLKDLEPSEQARTVNVIREALVSERNNRRERLESEIMQKQTEIQEINKGSEAILEKL